MWATALLFLKGLSWQTYVVIGLGLAAVGIYAEKTGHIDLLEHELASMTTKRDGLQTAIDDAKALGKKADAENKAIGSKRESDFKEDANEAQRMSIHARDDHAAADAAHDRLLQRAVASGCQSSSNPQAPEGSAPASGSGLLLTDVLRKSDERTGQLAGYADQARIAGLTCERAFDALTTYGDD